MGGGAPGAVRVVCGLHARRSLRARRSQPCRNWPPLRGEASGDEAERRVLSSVPRSPAECTLCSVPGDVMVLSALPRPGSTLSLGWRFVNFAFGELL